MGLVSWSLMEIDLEVTSCSTVGGAAALALTEGFWRGGCAGRKAMS